MGDRVDSPPEYDSVMEKDVQTIIQVSHTFVRYCAEHVSHSSFKARRKTGRSAKCDAGDLFINKLSYWETDVCVRVNYYSKLTCV